MLLRTLCLCALALFGCCVGDSLVIPTTFGPVQGKEVAASRAWLGIPFAAPPVDDLRWMAAQMPQSWTSPLDATSFKPGCPQHCNLPPVGCQDDISEDCLYLNVYSPKGDVSNLPVLVFFHGGRFEQGSEGVELYDGQNLANLTDTVVVTSNYRIGVLGFMAGLDGFEGNYGVRDQRLALEWVRDNIAQFGGNPGNVTIFGQSAGGSSVAFHMVAKGSKGLFHRAILESCPFALPLLDTKGATKHYTHFASETKCAKNQTAECLRSLTWEEVVEAQTKAQQKIYLSQPTVVFYPWTPVIDGNDLEMSLIEAFNTGQYTHVDTIVGHVGQEGWLFVYEAFPKLSKTEATLLIDAIFAKIGVPKGIFELYGIPSPDHTPDYRPWIAEIASDYILNCPARNVSRKMSQDGLQVSFYNFDHAWVERGAWGPNYTFCEGHPCHGVELPFVFDSSKLCGYNFTQAEENLSVQMAKYWGNFAATGSPNSESVPSWPPYQAGKEMMLHMEPNNLTAVANYRQKYCDFWDKVGYIF